MGRLRHRNGRGGGVAGDKSWGDGCVFSIIGDVKGPEF